MRYPLKKYQIWIGYYNMGQGSTPSTEPQLVATIKAPRFDVACLLYELESNYKFIQQAMKRDQYIDHQTCEWFYNRSSNSNSWTGKYYETKQEAQKSFE